MRLHHKPTHPAFTCSNCHRTHICPCHRLLQYSLHPTTRTFVDQTVQAPVPAVMVVQSAAESSILVNWFTPELLHQQKRLPAQGSADQTRHASARMACTTLMTCVIPRDALRSRQGFPRSVASPKIRSSSNPAYWHARRAVGRAGAAGGLAWPQNASGWRRDPLQPRALNHLYYLTITCMMAIISNFVMRALHGQEPDHLQ